MIVYHAGVTTAADYITRREPHRKAHLERLTALRARGLCIGGGPAPDGLSADIFYRVEQPGDVTRLIEEDPYFTGGAWMVTLVEGEAADPEMASFALIEARGAGRMTFGGFFPDGQTLALMRASDPDEAVASLGETGLWKPETLRGRPLLHVL